MSSMRTYHDGCSSAHALDLVGERWALLIVRDLLFGPKRFSDLHKGLPHGSPNVLTQRLRELEAAGIVQRRKLPPPASTMVYELTEWGAELEPVLLGLQRWGAHSPSMPHDVAVGCDAAMLALKNTFDPDAPGAPGGPPRAEVEVRFDAGTFAVRVDGGTIDITRGPADAPDAVLETDPTTLEELAFSDLTVAKAERAERLTVQGDHDLVEGFFHLFPAGDEQ